MAIANIRPRKLISILLLLMGCGVPGVHLSPWSATYEMLGNCRALPDPVMLQRCVDETMGSTEDENLVRAVQLTGMSRQYCEAIVDVRTRALDFRFDPEYGYAEDAVLGFMLNTLPRETSMPGVVILKDSEIRGAVAYAYRFAGVEQLRMDNVKLFRVCLGLPPTPGPRVTSEPFDKARWRNTMENLYGGPR
jgi:hypothetical protein